MPQQGFATAIIASATGAYVPEFNALSEVVLLRV
jgi:hypothetical protein